MEAPDVLEALLAGEARTVVVAAHPDDETLGAGALLGRLSDVRLLTVTDGAPLDRRRPDPVGDPERLAYAARRREELGAALGLVGLSPERQLSLDVVDQEAVLAIAGIARAVRELLLVVEPDVVLTHAYEGGHPDHDATAVAVHAAVTLLRQQQAATPAVVEMALYHAEDGRLVGHRFLGESGRSLPLTPGDRARKLRMIATFGSQQAALAPFTVAAECFRLAPAYDFLAPPHPGTLHYEARGWRLTGAEFRAHVADALGSLGLGRPPWP